MVRFFFPVLLGGSLVITSLSCAGLVEQVNTTLRKAELEHQAEPTLIGLAGALNLGTDSSSVARIFQVSQGFSSPSTGMAPAVAPSLLKALAEITGATLNITCAEEGQTLNLTFAERSVTEGVEKTVTLDANQCTLILPPTPSPTTPQAGVRLNGKIVLTLVFPSTSPEGDPSRISVDVPGTFEFSSQTPLTSTTLNILILKNYSLDVQRDSRGTLLAVIHGTISSGEKDLTLNTTRMTIARFNQFSITSEPLSDSKLSLTVEGEVETTPPVGGAQCTIGAYRVKTLEPLIVKENSNACPQSGKVEVQGATSELHAIYTFQGSTILVQDPDRPDIQTTVTCEAVRNNANQCGLPAED
jgi:hypothetical protein